MTSRPEPVSAMTTPLIPVTPKPAALNAANRTPAAAWSRRVRRVGGFIQVAFAAFWLGRASLAIGGPRAQPGSVRRPDEHASG